MRIMLEWYLGFDKNLFIIWEEFGYGVLIIGVLVWLVVGMIGCNLE